METSRSLVRRNAADRESGGVALGTDTLGAGRDSMPADTMREPTPGDVIERLLRTAAHVGVEQTRRLRHTSLSPSAFNVLLALADTPDQALQPCALAERLGVSRPSMCGLIDGLQAKGLATRTPHRSDGRRVLVALSAAGRRVVDEHRRDYEATVDALLDDLSGNERQRLIGLLQRICP